MIHRLSLLLITAFVLTFFLHSGSSICLASIDDTTPNDRIVDSEQGTPKVDEDGNRDARADLEKLQAMRERLQESRSETRSPTLVELVFSSPIAIAGVLAAFLAVWGIVYLALKTSQSTKGE